MLGSLYSCIDPHKDNITAVMKHESLANHVWHVDDRYHSSVVQSAEPQTVR